MQSNIFLNIASYRDPELLPTILDCLDKAKYKDRIFFGVYEEDVRHNKELDNIKNLVYNYQHYTKNKGTGYSRNFINKYLYKNQDFVLQIDSHSRFLKDWDVKYIEDFSKACEQFDIKDGKLVLTGFPPAYFIGEEYSDYIQRPTNNWVVPIEIIPSANYHIKAQDRPFTSEFELTVYASGANTFMPKEFVINSVYEKYVDPYKDQELISLACYLLDYKLAASLKPKVFHCYNNNNVGSPDKYRTLVVEDNIERETWESTLEAYREKFGNKVDQWVDYINEKINYFKNVKKD